MLCIVAVSSFSLLLPLYYATCFNGNGDHYFDCVVIEIDELKNIAITFMESFGTEDWENDTLM
jgi:hypothetical protein